MTRRVVRSPGPLAAKRKQEPHKEGIVTTLDLGLLDDRHTRKKSTIGIDPSTHMGVVAFCPDDETAHCWLIEPKDMSGVRRLVELKRVLEWTLQQIALRTEVEHICMEGFSFGSQNKRELLGEVACVTRLALIHVFGYAKILAYPSIVQPTHVKMMATGKGNAQKSDIKLGVYKKWGREFRSDDLADAYTLSRTAAAIARGAQTAFERDVIGRIRTHTEWPQQEQSPTKSKARKSRSSG